MAFNISSCTLILISLLLLQFLPGTNSATFTIINDCNDIIWPAMQSNDASPPLSTTGFSLGPRLSETVSTPANWSGRLWARTHCTTDDAGKFSCITGDCGSSAVECGGGNLSPPATTLDFTLLANTYHLSLVDGYNLPIVVQGGTGPVTCGTVGCVIDVNSGSSPSELRVTSGSDDEIVGLKSACGAFEEARYCCSTGISNSRPTTCNPNSYSDLFKKWCPQAQTFAYDDDPTTTVTCQSVDYVVQFCLSTVTGTGSSAGDNVENLDSFYEGKKTHTKFILLWIAAAVVMLGIVLLLWAWSCWSKSKSERHTCRNWTTVSNDKSSSTNNYKLKLNSGACYLPHPNKKEKGGEDAHFISENERAIGVADGVGGWENCGIDAGLFARELMSNAVLAIREEPKADIDPARVLEKAYSKTKANGSSTACIIALTGKELNAINLGDSGFMVIRDGCKVFRSGGQQHEFNYPYQLQKCGEGGDPPSSGEVFRVGVGPGDVIVAGSDGLFDNLYDYEITNEVVDSLRADLKPHITAQNIAALAREVQLDDLGRLTPFATSSHQQTGRLRPGGKLDDTTVIVSYVVYDKCTNSAAFTIINACNDIIGRPSNQTTSVRRRFPQQASPWARPSPRPSPCPRTGRSACVAELTEPPTTPGNSHASPENAERPPWNAAAETSLLRQPYWSSR